MHTMLIFRGDKNYRLTAKIMLDDELFLEGKMEYHPTYKTNGHTLTDTDDLIEDVRALSQEPGQTDGKARPHSATHTPMPYRIAAYDNQGRLSSMLPIGLEHVARKTDIDALRATTSAALAAEVTKFRNWIAWILVEITQVLNHDPNAFNTLMDEIHRTSEQLYAAILLSAALPDL